MISDTNVKFLKLNLGKKFTLTPDQVNYQYRFAEIETLSLKPCLKKFSYKIAFLGKFKKLFSLN
jgi:hypothetical protein